MGALLGLFLVEGRLNKILSLVKSSPWKPVRGAASVGTACGRRWWRPWPRKANLTAERGRVEMQVVPAGDVCGAGHRGQELPQSQWAPWVRAEPTARGLSG